MLGLNLVVLVLQARAAGAVDHLALQVTLGLGLGLGVDHLALQVTLGQHLDSEVRGWVVVTVGSVISGKVRVGLAGVICRGWVAVSIEL